MSELHQQGLEFQLVCLEDIQAQLGSEEYEGYKVCAVCYLSEEDHLAVTAPGYIHTPQFWPINHIVNKLRHVVDGNAATISW